MTSVKNLTALQMTVMNVLWQLGEATVAQVHAAVQEKRQLALSTVATVLSRLEKYGLLSHRTEGRQYPEYSRCHFPSLSNKPIFLNAVAERLLKEIL